MSVRTKSEPVFVIKCDNCPKEIEYDGAAIPEGWNRVSFPTDSQYRTYDLCDDCSATPLTKIVAAVTAVLETPPSDIKPV